jgi:hypothetical protein
VETTRDPIKFVLGFSRFSLCVLETLFVVSNENVFTKDVLAKKVMKKNNSSKDSRLYGKIENPVVPSTGQMNSPEGDSSSQVMKGTLDPSESGSKNLSSEETEGYFSLMMHITMYNMIARMITRSRFGFFQKTELLFVVKLNLNRTIELQFLVLVLICIVALENL